MDNSRSEKHITKKYLPANKGKASVNVSIWIEAKLFEEFDIFCKKKIVSKNLVIHTAMRKYMKLGNKFNVKTDKFSSTTRQDYIRAAIEWYISNEQKD
jgi:metal-responsive CopG/Arc/MetJ family transcriptional regulator